MRDRTSWTELAKDPEIGKKLLLGATSLVFLLPTPIALGLLNTDLEKEAQRRQAKQPPLENGHLPKMDDLGGLLSSGFGPTMVYAGALLLFAIATIPFGLSYFNLYAIFRPANELVPELRMETSTPYGSVIVFALIALVGLLLQAIVATSLPIALAQYARGKDIRPALDVIANASTVVELGASYWFKASGTFLGLLVMTFVFITGGFGLNMVLSTLLCVAVCALAFASLILSSRQALEHLVTEFQPTPAADLDDF